MRLQLDHHHNFPSTYVQARNVDVWLPSSYQRELKQNYGVLYMHDGQNLFDPDLAYTGIDWGVVPALEKLTTARAVPEVIIVGIWNTQLRVPEYLPQRPFETPKGQKALADLGSEVSNGLHSDAYLNFLVKELKPFIDNQYRTIHTRAHTTIMGSSMGSLISLYALCEYPDLFGAAGCLSTHWPIVDSVILDYLTQKLPPPGHHHIYFDYGTEGIDILYESYQEKVDTLMQSAGYTFEKDWITKRFEGADHNEKSWRERVHIPLKFLLGR